jgi:hypothetical protein
MAQKGPFELFLPTFWRHVSTRHDFVARPAQSLCAAVPKSCSFHLGVSPRFGKHVLIHLQHSSKAYDAGEFCINVHVSQHLAPAKPWLGSTSSFGAFDDGFYRLSACVEGKDRWWCLAQKGEGYSPREENQFRAYWEPSSYADQTAVFEEASAAVCGYLKQHLFPLAGFTATS